MTITELWGYIVGGMGLVSIIATLIRNHRGDVKRDGQTDGVLLTELGYIKSGIDTIQRRLDKQDQNYLSLVERMSKVEAAAAQAHNRLDRIEGGRKAS